MRGSGRPMSAAIVGQPASASVRRTSRVPSREQSSTTTISSTSARRATRARIRRIVERSLYTGTITLSVRRRGSSRLWRSAIVASYEPGARGDRPARTDSLDTNTPAPERPAGSARGGNERTRLVAAGAWRVALVRAGAACERARRLLSEAPFFLSHGQGGAPPPTSLPVLAHTPPPPHAPPAVRAGPAVDRMRP